MNAATLVQKLWNYCSGPALGLSLARSPAREHAATRVQPRLTLRDDGMSYGDYVEQLTCLLFLKMADERSRPQYHQPSPIPACFFAILDSPLPYVRKTQKRVQENHGAGEAPCRLGSQIPRMAGRLLKRPQRHAEYVFDNICTTGHSWHELGCSVP